ncbi:MAG: VOC family protein [Pseudomonadota bacterium]
MTARPSHDAAPDFGAVTLFSSDLSRSKAFYCDFLGTQPVFEDDVSAAYRSGSVIVNLLALEAVDELISPSEMATAGVRSVFTLHVEDVDMGATALADCGILPTSGPMNRPWGIRTTNYLDPDGYVWELSQKLG